MKLLKNYKTKYLKLKKYNKTQNKRTNQTGGSLPSIEELEYANNILEIPINSDTISQYLSTNHNPNQPIKIDVDHYIRDHYKSFINDHRAVYYLILIALMHSNGVIPYLDEYILKNGIEELYLIDYQNVVAQLNLIESKFQRDIINYASQNPNTLYLYIVTVDTQSKGPRIPVNIIDNVIKITLDAKKINNTRDTKLKYIGGQLDMSDEFTQNLHKYLKNMNIIQDNDININEEYINTSKQAYFGDIREKYFYNVKYNYKSNEQDNSILIPYFKIHVPHKGIHEYNSIANVSNGNLDILYINEFDKHIGFGANSIDDILLFILGAYIYDHNYNKSMKINVVSNDKYREFSGTFINMVNSMPNKQTVEDFATMIGINSSSTGAYGHSGYHPAPRYSGSAAASVYSATYGNPGAYGPSGHSRHSRPSQSQAPRSAKRNPTSSGRPPNKRGPKGGGYKLKMTKKLNKYKSNV